MLTLIENPKQTGRTVLTSISSNIQNKLSEKLLLGSLAISFAFCPTGTTYLQNGNAKCTNMQYTNNASSNGNTAKTSKNNCVVIGNNIECNDTPVHGLVKLSYTSGINLSESSYNTVINLNEDNKDVDSMLSKEIYNIKGKISKAYKTTEIIKDFGEFENNEVERLNVTQGKKVKIKGKITSVKRSNDLLI